MIRQSPNSSNHGANRVVLLEVQAHWDADAGVWWAESDDLPGLVTEAPSLPDLVGHIKSLAPFIIRENLGRAPG
jgi:hypothetical protein